MNPPKSAEEVIKNNMPESEVLEYKAALPKGPTRTIAKQIAAMANAKGGLIIIGIDEKQGEATPENVVGVQHPDQVERQIAGEIHNKLQPDPTEIIKRTKHENKNLIEIHVNKGKDTCVFWNNHKPEFWKRCGSGMAEMLRPEVEKIIFNKAKTRKITIIQTPKCICISPDHTALNIILYFKNTSDEPISLKSIDILLCTNSSEIPLTPKHLFEETPNGYIPITGAITPFEIAPHSDITKKITCHGSTFQISEDSIKICGRATTQTEKIKIPDQFVTTSDPIAQGDNKTTCYNLVEIDKPRLIKQHTTKKSTKAQPQIIPELHPQPPRQKGVGYPPYAAAVFIKNTSNASAKDVRIKVQHTENSSLGFKETSAWNPIKDQNGLACLNPRKLEAKKPIHSGEDVGTFRIEFREDCPETLQFNVELTCLDQPKTTWEAKVSREQLKKLQPIPFNKIA